MNYTFLRESGGMCYMEKDPLKLLAKSINNVVLVKLKNGLEYKGRLIEVDNYMNLVLSSAEEVEEGEPKAKYGEIFIRGNNILFIKPDITETDWEE